MAEDKETIDAAIKRLEAERLRRVEEKIANDKAVLVPPRILGAPEPSRPRTKDAKGREIYHGTRTKEGEIEFIDAIITGVPRMGRDVPDEPRATPSKASHPPQPERVDMRRGGEALRLPEKERETHQPQPTPQPMPEPRYVYAEMHPASGNDPGAIIEGRYASADGLVRVWDMQGKLLGTQVFNGDNPAHVARKILREKRGTGFYDPLPYPRNNVV
jgi:hypothetical protein